MRNSRRAALLAVAILLAACAGGEDSEESQIQTPPVAPETTVRSTTTDPPVPATTTTTAPTTTATTERPLVEWNLLVGGDVLMDRSEPAGVDVVAGLEPPLASADLAIVNVEMAISDRGTPVDKGFVFRAPPSAAARLGAAGIDVASMGNNHARDYGGDALTDSLDLLERAGVQTVGAGADRTAAFAPATVEIGDLRVGVVGISFVVPSGFAATSERAGVASGHQTRDAVAAVREAAVDHDVVIAVVHWGIERQTCPSGAQREQARTLLDAGATAILGSHPHVLQPVERLDDGRVVVWSLGNFIWHARSGITGETALVELRFDDVAVTDVLVHPHVLDADGAPVVAPEGGRRDRILDITSGDCARHQPPPPTTTTVPETTLPPETTAPPGSETTTVPETTVPPETSAVEPPPETTTAPETGGGGG